MSNPLIQKIHKVYTSAAPHGRPRDPKLEAALDQPHLAVMLGNGELMPIIPGTIVIFVKNRQHVDGIAPYILTKVNAKTLHEYLDFVAWSTNPKSSRKMRLGVKYSGKYKSGLTDADSAIDAVEADKK
jgi:hypothetical protein